MNKNFRAVFRNMNHEIKMKNNKPGNRLLKDFFKLMFPSVIIFTVFMVMIFAIYVPYLEKKHIEDRENLCRNLVELVIDYLTSFQRDLPPGFITEAIARKRSINRIRDFRFGNEAKNYFWILDRNGMVIMHPFRQDIVNVDPGKVTAPDGRALMKLMKEMSEVADSSPEGGAIRYVWSRRDEVNKLGNKIAWVQKFEPWDWTIGTGVYLDEVESEIYLWKKNSIAAGVVLALFSAAFSLFLSFRAESHRKKEEYTREQLVESEKNLRIREELFRTIFEKSPHGIVIADPDGKRIFNVNKAFSDITGYPLQELIQKDIYRHIYPELKEKNRDFIPIILETGFIENVNAMLFTRSGNRREIIYSAILISYMGQKAILEMVVDVTEEKLLEEQLRQSQKMDVMGRLAGGIAHDFNNMLSVIMGSAELLLLEQESWTEQKKYISRIRETCEKAAALIRKLMLFSRKGGIVFRNIDIHNNIKNVADILEHTIDKRIKVELNLNAECSSIKGDANLIENALLNLALNSRDAMPGGGVISISTADTYLDEFFVKAQSFVVEPGHYIEINVSDTGEGMTPEVVSKIFEPFFTTKPPGKGTGLGLSAVYGTVHEHCGTIDVYSEPGMGTEFKLYLPCLVEGKSVSVPDFLPPVYGAGTVLVIDDDAKIRANLIDMLSALGYRVIEASGGKEGIEIYRTKQDEIDLIIIDMIMPVMTGAEAIEVFNELDSNVKIIISSGFHNEDSSIKNNSGVMGYLQKPFRINELSILIRSVLQEK
jgi:PAS domain S-box-containing protein